MYGNSPVGKSKVIFLSLLAAAIFGLIDRQQALDLFMWVLSDFYYNLNQCLHEDHQNFI